MGLLTRNANERAQKGDDYANRVYALRLGQNRTVIPAAPRYVSESPATRPRHVDDAGRRRATLRQRTRPAFKRAPERVARGSDAPPVARPWSTRHHRMDGCVG